MTLTRAAAALVFALVASALGCASRAPPSVVVIEAVTIIDPSDGTARDDMTVIVIGRRIARVGSSATTRAPAGSRVLDGRGRYLIPGLWDMHAHPFGYSFAEFFAPLALANGVTGVREMGYYVDTAARYRALVAGGHIAGPRLVVGGRVDGPGNRTPWVTRVASAADARVAVDTLTASNGLARRADFIKVYSLLPRAAYFAVAEAAKKRGLAFAGHVPYSVSVAEAADAGQRSIEHEDDFMRGCSTREAELRRLHLETDATRGTNELLAVRAEARSMIATFDSTRCTALIARLARDRTWLTPTLVVYQPYAHAFDSASTQPGLLAEVPIELQREWRRRAERVEASDTAIVAAYFSFFWTGALHRGGVRLLVGTDAPLPYVYPGVAVHDEMTLLVKSGLTNAEALRAATFEPAAYLAALDSLGSIAEGKLADLVLLDANPLQSIANTRRVYAVVADGRVFDRRALAALHGRARVYAAQR